MKTTLSTLLPALGLCLLLAPAFADSTPVLQGDTAHPYKFLVISSTDHITGLTGQSTALLAALHVRKNAAATVVPTGTLTEEDSTNMPGWYDYTPSALDVNTLGIASFHTSVATSDPVDFSFNVVAVNSYDASLFGLSGVGTLAGQTTISGKTNLIATNAADSPAAVTAQGTLIVLSKRTLNRQTYNPATKVLQLLNDDGTNYGPSLTLTIDANNNITAR